MTGSASTRPVHARAAMLAVAATAAFVSLSTAASDPPEAAVPLVDPTPGVWFRLTPPASAAAATPAARHMSGVLLIDGARFGRPDPLLPLDDEETPESVAAEAAHADWTPPEVLPTLAVESESPTPAATLVLHHGPFSVDAREVTPLVAGKRVFAWELGDGVTLAGVGSRRIWTERTRSYVLSAEAALRLSPHAGLAIGYELLQASSGGPLPNAAEAESIFARFQLRF